jgi:hypothetical protein
VAVGVGRPAELADQQDGVAVGIVEEDRRAVAAVIRLALVADPGAVAAPQLEAGLAQDVVVVGQDLLGDVADAGADRPSIPGRAPPRALALRS